MTTKSEKNGQGILFKYLFLPFTTFKAIIFIILIGLVVYLNILSNDFIGDDNAQLLSNPVVHSVTYIPQLFTGSTFYNGTVQLTGLWYRPLELSIYTIIYSLFGANPFPFHFLQIILHITNAVMVFLIFRYFFKTGLAFMLSLLFLVHPMNSETVAYIANLDDILFFLFGSFALYLQLTLKEGIKKTLLIAFLLLLSLFSKESGLLFMTIIAFYKLLFHRKGFIKLIFSYIGIIFIYGYLRIFVSHIPYTLKLSSSPIMELSFFDRMMTYPPIILYYLKSAILPIHPAISQMWTILNLSSYEFYSSIIIDLLVLILVLMLGFLLYKKHRKYFKTYLFFAVWLCSGLLFYSQLVIPFDFTVSDNWFYFPLVGLIGVIGVLFKVYCSNNKKMVRVFICVALVIITVFSIRTIVRNTNFYNNFTLVTHDIKYSQYSSTLDYGLGNEYFSQGNLGQAEPYLVKAVKLDDQEPISWNTLGILYEQTGQINKAQRAYQTALKLYAYAPAYENYAMFLFLHGQLEKAEQITKSGLLRFPSDGDLWMVEAFIEYKTGDQDKALTASKYADQYSPSNLTNTVFILLSRHLHFNIYNAWNNQEREIGVAQS